MAGFLRVRNWSEFQHYKDRTPPWIKLHRDLLRDYKFSCLQDASKLHLVLIWLLASQLDNEIPNDSAWIQRQIGVSEPVDLKSLIDIGFLECSKTLAPCKQSAMPETEAYKQETEKEYTRKRKIPKDFGISERVQKWAEEKGHSRLEEHLEAFILKANAKGYQYKNWDSAFMEAVRADWAGLKKEGKRTTGTKSSDDFWESYEATA